MNSQSSSLYTRYKQKVYFEIAMASLDGNWLCDEEEVAEQCSTQAAWLCREVEQERSGDGCDPFPPVASCSTQNDCH